MRRTNNDSIFGIEGYTIPKTAVLNPRTTKFSRFKVPHFIDVYAKSKSFVPGPVYETVTDWKQSLKGYKGVFNKSPRVTFTENIIKTSKLKDQPGPGAYEHLSKSKSNKNGSAKTDKYCAFIEEASFMG